MKRLTFISQLDKKDCGITCLLMILKYYGGDVSREYLRILAHQDQYGVNAYYLIDAASHLGLEGKGVEGPLEEVTQSMLPCIAHICFNGYEHFVVIEKIDQVNQIIYLLDPASGRKKYNFLEYQKVSTNQYLCFQPKAKVLVLKEEKKFSHFCFSFLSLHWYLIIAILLCLLLVFLFELICTYHFQWILDYGIFYQQKGLLRLFFLLILVFFFLAGIFRLVEMHFMNQLTMKFQQMISSKVIHHILHLPYQYHQYHTAGELLSKFSFLEQILYIFYPILNVITSMIILAILLFLLGRIHLYFFLFFLLFFLIEIILSKIKSPFFNRRLKQTKQELTLLNSKLTECFYGITSIKNMHIERDVDVKMENRLWNYLMKGKKLKMLLQITEEGKRFIHLLMEHFILTLGGGLLLNQEITLSELLITSFLSRLAISQSEILFHFPQQWIESKTSFQQLNDLLAGAQEDFSYKESTSLKPIQGLIRLKQFSFEIHESKSLFQQVSLVIKKGEKVALLGSSGSGKSTLLKILMHYYDIPHQMIYIDEKDLLEYPLEIIRESVCYVSQEETLFSDTIYQNIMLNQKIDYDEFLLICKITDVNSIIKNSLLGYQYQVEENGVNLSGGERQRIILARALAKRAKIYLFDEAFNQLDIMKERQVMKAIFSYLEGRTILVVSHRKNNLDLFSRRLILADQNIVDDYLYFR